jgi:FAD-linked sulfhydryl oxidase
MATKFWGPLGWMTLHSISAIYPEEPTLEEKTILNSFMESFRESMTCPHCKGHFTSMFNTYRIRHPEWNTSRFDFFLFVCRAHNTVNKRLDKPIFPTINDCIERLKLNTQQNSATTYRNAYINYLINNWTKEFTGDGAIFLQSAKTMKKINEEYFTPRDEGFTNLKFDRDASVTDFIPEDSRVYNVGPHLPNAARFSKVRVGFVGGRLRLK